MHGAFLELGCALICFNYLRRLWNRLLVQVALIESFRPLGESVHRLLYLLPMRLV